MPMPIRCVSPIVLTFVGACDLWPVEPFDPGEASTTENSSEVTSATTVDKQPTDGGSTAMESTATSELLTSVPSTSAVVTTTPGETTASATGATAEDTEDTTAEPCAVMWEDCADGAVDDNCDGVDVCEGEFQMGSPVFGPDIFELHVVPASDTSIGEFHLIATYVGDVGIVGVPNAIERSLFTARYDAGTQELTVTDYILDVEKLEFARGAGHNVLVTRDKGGVSTLHEYDADAQELVTLDADFSALLEIQAVAVTNLRIAVGGKCDQDPLPLLCVATFVLSNESQTLSIIPGGTADLTDLLVDEQAERMIGAAVGPGGLSALYQAFFAFPQPASSLSGGQYIIGQDVEINRIAFDGTPGHFVIAGKVAQGNFDSLGPAAGPRGDVNHPCHSASSDLFVARFAVDLMADSDRAVRSSCADGPRGLDVMGLTVGPGGDVFVSGGFQGALAFDQDMTTLVGDGGPITRSLFVMRFPADYENVAPYWIDRAEVSPTGFSYGSSIALDPKHVIVGARLRSATMMFAGQAFVPNPETSKYSATLLATYP